MGRAVRYPRGRRFPITASGMLVALLCAVLAGVMAVEVAQLLEKAS